MEGLYLGRMGEGERWTDELMNDFPPNIPTAEGRDEIRTEVKAMVKLIYSRHPGWNLIKTWNRAQLQNNCSLPGPPTHILYDISAYYGLPWGQEIISLLRTEGLLLLYKIIIVWANVGPSDSIDII